MRVFHVVRRRTGLARDGASASEVSAAAFAVAPTSSAGSLDRRSGNLLGLMALGGLVLIGAATRVLLLDRREMTLDEAYSFALAQREFADMLELFRLEANGVLYPLALWPVARLEDSIEAIRAPALAAGLVAIGAVYWAGREYLGHRAAAFGAALFALTPALSLDARGYSFAIMFVALSYGCLARAVRKPQRKLWWVLYALTLVGAAYSSTIVVAVLPLAQLLAVLPRARTALRPWLVSLAAVAITLFPLAALLVAESSARDPLYWETVPGFRDVVSVAAALAGSSTNMSGGRALSAVIFAVAALAVGVAIWTCKPWRLSLRGALSSPAAAIVAWAVVSLIIVFSISQYYPIFQARYVSGALPGIALVLGLCISLLPRAVGLAVLASLCTLLVAAPVLAQNQRIGYLEAGRWLDTTRAGGDALVLYPMEQLAPLAYYARSLRVGPDLIPVEEWRDTVLPAGVTGYKLPGGYGLTPVGPPSTEALERLARRSNRIFVVSLAGFLGETKAWGEANCSRVASRSFSLLEGLELSSCSPKA
ncbi:MAG: hypothetical protein HW413_976 [Thermoleophilia bacterium]|nr:hypothetical protein [Thermoleophilia bacterium]